VFFTLLVITSFLYYALLKSMEEEDRQFLSEKLDTLRDIMQARPDDLAALDHEINTGAELHFIKYFARIVSEQGHVLAQTSDSSFHVPDGIFAPQASPQDTTPTFKRRRVHDGKVYLIMTAWAKENKPDGRRYLLQTALDISREAGIVRRYRIKVEIALFAGILISASVGFIIARRAMKPLREITRVIQRIRASKLGERLRPSQWPQELTTLATAFDDMLDRLEDSFTRLSQFSSDLAHELRTPINNLMGEAEVTLARPREPLEYQQHIESNLEEFSKLSHMIESLLFLARAESTDISIERISFDPVKEIQTVLEYYDALREEKKTDIACRGTAMLSADPLLFRRVINNILSNAFKYTPSGGSIDITVQEASGQYVEITIRDTGIGIAQEDIAQLFKRFYRGQQATSIDSRGTGLGLAIVKSIMDLHGGDVDIRSEPSTGTTVILTFPLPS
jgi:two-component system heavy metal sensor histidine kinase CusS